MTNATQPAPLSAAPFLRASKVEIARVVDPLEKDRFIKFQWQIYRNDLHWVPPLLMERHEFLDPSKNPFHQHADVALFLARRGGEVVGRIAAIEDRNFNAFHGTRTAYFGLFESVNDVEVAGALVGAAKDWARWRGLDRLLGPMNLSTNYEIGLLVEGFESDPCMMMTYNPRYYGALLERCGLVKAKDLFAWERSPAAPPPERFLRIADRLRQDGGVTVRGVNMRRFHDEVETFKQVYQAAWKQNWGFVPMTDAEMNRMARDLKPIIDPELCLVAESEGEPVAVTLTIPDYNQALKRLDGRLTRFGLPLGLGRLLWNARKIDRMRLITLGVKSGFRRRGIPALLVVETIERARRLGYVGAEISWTLEDNALINGMIESCGCSRTKVYRMYEGPTG